MTIRTRTFTAGEIVRHAYVQAAVLNVDQAVSAGQMGYALDVLDMLINGLAVEGIFPRDVVVYELSLVSGQLTYQMPDWVYDVVDTGMWRAAGEPYPTNSEIPVRPISRQTYTERTGKASQGVPKEYFVDRTAMPPSVTLWPVPGDSEATSVIRFQCHQLKFRSEAGSSPDVENYWSQYLVEALGSKLAFAAGFKEQSAALLAQATQSKTTAKSYANERTNQQMIIAHRAGWRSR